VKFGNAGFSGESKTGEPGEKPFEAKREPTTNTTHIRHRAATEPGGGGGEPLTLPPFVMPIIIIKNLM